MPRCKVCAVAALELGTPHLHNYEFSNKGNVFIVSFIWLIYPAFSHYGLGFLKSTGIIFITQAVLSTLAVFTIGIDTSAAHWINTVDLIKVADDDVNILYV